ncbi:hypothetical protein [Pseudonocardia sp. ICBG601]|uniref:hypothetical protein n=1 Tax=Pseudonocardia sp. ICBG601 TaxID=2846759 RepID=UPI001CF62C0A|nr:hypothetical protein [Pseudonocardia sp. ICBG601]
MADAGNFSAVKIGNFIVHVYYRGGSPPETVFVEIVEYARTEDLRTIQVRKHGWAQSVGRQSMALELMELKQGAINHLLPDDTEKTGEAQAWEMIQRRLRQHDIDVTVEELKKIPVVVNIDKELKSLIVKFRAG